jgi:hypothetical protein
MTYEQPSLIKATECGSWMPVDDKAHWDWSNPFNLLVLLPLLGLLASVIAMF